LGCIIVAFVRNLENFFERYIEGFFNKKFSSGLQPVEIAKHLVKEMNAQRSVGISQVYVPNSYSVYINSDDYDRIVPYGQAIRDELSRYLIEEAEGKNYTIIGKPIVDIFLNESIGKGSFFVTSRFTEPLPVEQDEGQNDDTNDNSSKLSDTRVFTKVTSMLQSKVKVSGSLSVITGLDEGMTVDISTSRVNIGRRESNEMPLTDMNTSRLHSYIVCEDGKHVLYDAKSLNGTYVNGHRITRKTLQTGDRIKVGNTIILYEVN